MSNEIKVTDKRIFTPEGDLKEEYRHLEEERRGAEPPAETKPPVESPIVQGPDETTNRGDAGGVAVASPSDHGGEPGRRGPGPGGPASPETDPFAGDLGGAAGRSEDEPSFFDLLGLLAQPAALYLGDARLPDGRSAEDLELAKLHIDLLDLLREKTEGNLSAEESATLEDLLYQLRMRYVRKRG